MVFNTYDIAKLSPTLRGWTREHHVFTMVTQTAAGTATHRQILWSPLGVNTFRANGPLSVKYSWGQRSFGGYLTGRAGFYFFRLSKVIDDGAGGLVETDLIDEYSFGSRVPNTYGAQVAEDVKFASGLEIIINPKEALLFEVTEVMQGVSGTNPITLMIDLEFFSRNA